MKRLFLGLMMLCISWLSHAAEVIKVGILHSMSGTMAISERTVVDSTLMAIDEINSKGGVLGKQLVPVVKDGASDWPTFAQQAEALLKDEKVAVVFGCWTSASRKTVRPVFEKYNGLLFYPVQYEGVEASPNIVYTGAAPNQQLLPAVDWSINELGIKKFIMTGSDYVFPRTANAILRERILELGGEVLGEEYVPLGSHDIDGMIDKVAAAGEGVVILNTINGDTNVSFFNKLAAKGITSAKNPVVSFSIGEPELQAIGDMSKLAGHYAAWNYFQSIDNAENKAILDMVKAKYGPDTVFSDPMEAGYMGVHLWAKAATAAGSIDVDAVRGKLDQSITAPEGEVNIDTSNQHLYKTARVGKILNDGQFEIVWTSAGPIKPDPFPKYKTKEEWEAFLMELYKGWGGNWAKL